MSKQLTLEQSAKIDTFVKGLKAEARELTTKYIKVPNSPDCQPEIIGLYVRYGEKALSQTSDRIEALKTELGLDYDTLQLELQRRLSP